jgi:hypothetical protein
MAYWERLSMWNYRMIGRYKGQGSASTSPGIKQFNPSCFETANTIQLLKGKLQKNVK